MGFHAFTKFLFYYRVHAVFETHINIIHIDLKSSWIFWLFWFFIELFLLERHFGLLFELDNFFVNILSMKLKNPLFFFLFRFVDSCSWIPGSFSMSFSSSFSSLISLKLFLSLELLQRDSPEQLRDPASEGVFQNCGYFWAWSILFLKLQLRAWSFDRSFVLSDSCFL